MGDETTTTLLVTGCVNDIPMLFTEQVKDALRGFELVNDTVSIGEQTYPAEMVVPESVLGGTVQGDKKPTAYVTVHADRSPVTVAHAVEAVLEDRDIEFEKVSVWDTT